MVDGSALSMQGEIAKTFHLFFKLFFKDLFSHFSMPKIRINRDVILYEMPVGLVSMKQAFTLHDIKDALFSFEGNKTLILIVSLSFFHKFWNLVGNDSMVLPNDFYIGVLDLDQLNFTFITTIPKNRGSTFG